MPMDPHARVDFNFLDAAGGTASFRLFYTVGAGSITVANVAQVADEIQAVFKDVISACMCNSTGWRCKVRYLSEADDVEGTSTDDPEIGDLDSEILPERDAVVIRRRTGQAGRTRRGRIFVPFVPEELQADGSLNAGGIADYQALAYKVKVVLVLAVTGVTLNPVTPSYKEGVWVPVTETQTCITLCSRRDRSFPKKAIVVTTPP